MPRLHDLQTPLSELSQDELMERIRQVRDDRKINKYAITKSVATKRKKADKVSVALKDLSPEQLAELMKEFGDEG